MLHPPLYYQPLRPQFTRYTEGEEEEGRSEKEEHLPGDSTIETHHTPTFQPATYAEKEDTAQVTASITREHASVTGKRHTPPITASIPLSRRVSGDWERRSKHRTGALDRVLGASGTLGDVKLAVKLRRLCKDWLTVRRH